MDAPVVGGLELPRSLVEAIRAGRWKAPSDDELLRTVFRDTPDWPDFFTIAAMGPQNRNFQSLTSAALEEWVPGSGDGLGVEPSLAVIIGSLGADMPIALDYRVTWDNPRVIYLGEDGWHEVAADFATLCRLLDL